MNTARELLKTQALHDLSLNELARTAHMAKSNIYRYFESREALFLELLEEEWWRWCATLQASLSKETQEWTVDLLSQLYARTMVEQPLLPQLVSALPSVLEHNISSEAVLSFKLRSMEMLMRISADLAELAPALSQEEHAEWLNQGIVLVTGLWPYCHPSKEVAAVLETPGLERFRHDFEKDLARSLCLIGQGILAQKNALP